MALSTIKVVHTLEDIPVNSDFAQEREFERIIIQPYEENQINLNEYFRGQFLTYQLKGKTEAEQELIDKGIISLVKPVNEKLSINIQDNADPMTVHYTSDMFRNDIDDMFFMYIDHDLNLHIYDISQYKTGDITQIKQIADVSLYNSSCISPKKYCSSLTVIIEGRIYVLFCLSNAQQSNATLIKIDLTAENDPKLEFSMTEIQYVEFSRGRIEMLNPGLAQDYGYDIVVLSNKTSDNYKIFTIDKNFKLTLKKIYSQIEIIEEQDNLYYKYSSLNLQDLAPVENFPGIVILSDFLEGLFVVNITCNISDCDSKVWSSILIQSAGTIKLLQSKPHQFSGEILVGVVHPPAVIEVDLSDLYNPFITKKYYILPDSSIYIGLNLLEADDRFILVQLLRLEDFKPCLRIYSRYESMKSFAIYQYGYAPVFKYGHYMFFLDFNYFLLKTANFIQILKINSESLLINTQDILSTNITLSSDLVNTFELIVQDSNHNNMTRNIEVMFLPEDCDQTLTRKMQKKDQLLDGSSNRIYYNCGVFQNHILSIDDFNETMFDVLYIDDLFSGPINDIKIESLSTEDNYTYFNSSIPHLLEQPIVKNFSFVECQQSHIMYFISNEEFQYQLACIPKHGFKLFLTDILSDSLTLEQINIFEINELRTRGYIIDNKHSQILMFSDTNRKGDETFTLHVFKLYNILTWEKQQRVGRQFPILNHYQLDDYNPINFNDEIGYGIMRSIKLNNIVQIYVFSIGMWDDLNEFKPLARVNLTLDSRTRILDMTVQSSSYYWILLDNNTLLEFQLIQIHNSTLYNGLEYILKFIRTTVLFDGILSNLTQLWNFDYDGSKFIALSGQNQIFKYITLDQELDLNQNASMPLSYTDQENRRTYYSFVKDGFNQTVYAIYQKYLIILFNNTQNGSLVLNVYDTTQWRHNALLGEIPVPNEFYVDLNYTRLHVVTDDVDQIYLILQSKEQAMFFLFSVHYTLQISGANAVKLDQKCQTTDFELDFLLYPIINKKQYTFVKLIAKNNGLLIQSEKQKQNLTIMGLENPLTLGTYKIDASININEIFDGYNLVQDYYIFICIRFNYTLLEQKYGGDGQEQPISLQQSVLPEAIESAPIEFLSNKNRMVDFYTINDTMIVFDTSGYINVIYSIEKSKYERANASEILGCSNIIYSKFFHPYFLYQCNQTNNGQNFIRLGISKIYGGNLPKNESADDYKVFSESIYIKKTKPTQRLTKKIQSSALFDNAVNNTIIVILSFEIPKEQYLSTIKLYNVSVANNSLIITSDLYKIITADTLQFDNFKVTAIEVIPKTYNLVIALENFGLILFDLIDFKVRKIICLIKEVRYDDFIIKNIIAQDANNIHLILNKYGIMSLQISEILDYDQQLDPEIDEDYLKYEVSTYFNFAELEVCNNTYIAIDEQGFSFFTAEPFNYLKSLANKKNYLVRYFGYYYQNNTKLLASKLIVDGSQCSALKPYIYTLISKEYSYVDSKSYIMTALQCGPDLYFQLMARTNQLYIIHDDSQRKAEELQQSILLTAFNNHSLENVKLEVTLQSYDSSSEIWIYMAFVLIISGLLFMFQMMFKKVKVSTKNKKAKKSNNSQNESSQTQATMTTQGRSQSTVSGFTNQTALTAMFVQDILLK